MKCTSSSNLRNVYHHPNSQIITLTLPSTCIIPLVSLSIPWHCLDLFWHNEPPVSPGTSQVQTIKQDITVFPDSLSSLDCISVWRIRNYLPSHLQAYHSNKSLYLHTEDIAPTVNQQGHSCNIFAHTLHSAAHTNTPPSWCQVPHMCCIHQPISTSPPGILHPLDCAFAQPPMYTTTHSQSTLQHLQKIKQQNTQATCHKWVSPMMCNATLG